MQRKSVYAFIDSQNLNLGTSKDLFNQAGRLIYRGWKLDYQKFRRYLRDKFGVEQAFLFIGRMAKYETLYSTLRSFGYQLVFKPTVKDVNGKPKGNVDAELVLHAAAVEYPNYDTAVIVSGDGDFYCLYEFLEKREKLRGIIIPNKLSESSLLKKFQAYKVFIVREKDKVAYSHKNGRRGALSPDKRSFLPRDRVSIAKKRGKAR